MLIIEWITAYQKNIEVYLNEQAMDDRKDQGVQ